MSRVSMLLSAVVLLGLPLHGCGDSDAASKAGGCTIVTADDGIRSVECADGTTAEIADGKDGTDGVDGADAAQSTSIHSGIGLPAASLGKDGEQYYDVGRSALFQKSSGEWKIADLRDNHLYAYVTIGNQVWMAENLQYGTIITGLPGQDDDSVVQKYCYDDDPSNCDVYGGLYQWAQSMALPYACNADFEACKAAAFSPHQGICPRGWHIPTESEWQILKAYLGDNSGGKTKATGEDYWDAPNTGATNESGFTGLGSGYRTSAGSFQNLHTDAYWWLRTLAPSVGYFLYFDLWNEGSNMSFHNRDGFAAKSIRCVLD